MSTKDNNSGLLSKVAKFVRNPTTNWTDLDKQDAEADTGYSKQALKEMIERKRQNDFVRRREFDQLRKLRNRDPNAGTLDPAGRPSYFQSSLPANPGERASTIKKIDEIEAQMSNQWWQGKSNTAKPAGAGAVEPGAPGAPGSAAAAGAATGPGARAGAQGSDISYAPTKLAPMVPEGRRNEPGDFPQTQTISSFGKYAPRSTQTDAIPTAPGSMERVGFPNSRSFGTQMFDGASDPDLEEAAIRFANGDDGGAESALVEALRRPELRREQSDVWSSALFDLYRATGQQARFDNVAIEFAERFGRSPPAWFSMPERLGIRSVTVAVRTMPSRLNEDPQWSAPAQLTRASADELQLALANAPSPWFLDWGGLQTLDADAIEPLAALFDQWAAQPVHLRFRNSRDLLLVLRSGTPAGNKAMPQAAWRLRMDALRIMDMQDEFELVALEFCVTYELSPPPWQEVRCAYVREEADTAKDTRAADVAAEAEAAPEPPDSQGHTIPMGYDAAPAAVVELAGEILGEATDALTRLEDARQGAERLVVSCAHLIRVDFSAAGGILNWVAARQADGCQIQFRDVHRLVAAFFHVIGIHEHARIVLRSN